MMEMSFLATEPPSIQRRRRARRLWEIFRTPLSKNLYNRASKQAKFEIAKARIERFQRRCNELSKLLKDKPRLFWKEFSALATNQLSSTRRNYPPISASNGEEVYTDGAKATAFAEHLATNMWVTPDDPSFCKGTADLVARRLRERAADFKHPVEQPRKTAGRWHIYAGETISVVKRLKCTAPGEDGIQNAILRKAPPVFWEKATAIFNASLKYSYIPAKWKIAVVCMIPKEGKDWRTLKGYRPISLLNSLAKVLERLVARRIIGEMKEKGFLPACQSAFLNKHSVEDHSFRIAQLASMGLIEGEDTILVCLDVEGAFDRVWHQALLYKMYIRNLPPVALAWMASFLDGRTFRVRIGNSLSKSFPISGGVPQGSPLSPILYVLFTADLVDEIPANVTKGLFADDIALAKRHNDQREAIRLLNIALARVAAWFNRWRLKINATKSQALRISKKINPPPLPLQIAGQVIQWFDCIKYLGVWFDRYLSWRAQINTAVRKANGRTSAIQSLCRRRFGLTPRAATIVYQTYVLPVLTFGSQAWLGANDHQWEKIEVAQRNALRVAHRLYPWTPNTQVLEQAGLPTVRERASTLMIDWLDRANEADNLVGREVRGLVDQPFEERTYGRSRSRPPLSAAVIAARAFWEGEGENE